MQREPLSAAISSTGRFRIVRNWARESAVAGVTAVVLVTLVGTGHVLFAPATHVQVFPQTSLPNFLMALSGVTTLVALGGLVALGWAYISIVSYLDTGPRVDIEILPEDERRILGPILDAPGVTQVEVVDRSDFSDAKVSQTLKSLRERGLVYRESQGWTYRLYPGTVLVEPTSESRAVRGPSDAPGRTR